ncbi:MAG: 7TM diverse intracellular signaling domain-containing protein [Flavobacteriales bacterium]
MFFFSANARTIDLQKVEDDSLLMHADLSYFEDVSATLFFEKIQHQTFEEGKTQFRSVQNVESAYWVKLNFKDDSLRKFILEIVTPQTELIDFYAPIKSGGYNKISTGYLKKFEERVYLHKNFVFDLEHYFDYQKPFYVRVKSSNKVGLLFRIRTQQNFSQYSLNEYLLLGLYYGILIVLALYNLILFFSLKRIVYMFYSLTVLCAALISSSDDGFGFAYLWSNHPQWSQALGLYILPAAFLLFYTLYSIYFLDKVLLKYRKVILMVSAVYFLYFFSQLLFSSEKFYFSQLYILPFLTIYLVYFMVYFKEKYMPAKFFLAGNTFALIGVVVNQLRLLEVLPGNVFTLYSFDVGILLEFISLSLSLGYLYNLQIRENEKVQSELIAAQEEKILVINEKNALAEKVNRELENKVQERTIELKEANEKMAELVKKLDGINLDYDKENWELRTVIRDEKRSLLFNETLSFKEIKELYPTTESCLLYLSEMKWKDKEWHCECTNDKYSLNPKNYSRKCSRCGRIHSVTAGSIFHSQKLPLPSLFYIAHLVSKRAEMDVSVLSEELDISANSLYKFIKKLK